jgi:hypothetical protein
MRRLRAGEETYPPHSGGPGTPLGRHYGRSARSFAGLGALQWLRIAKASSAQKGMVPSPPKPQGKPGNAGPGTEKPRWSAERRPHSSQGNAARRKTGAPLGAPSPRLCREEKGPVRRSPKGRRRKDGVSRAAKNRDDGARLLSYLSPERGSRREAPGRVIVQAPPPAATELGLARVRLMKRASRIHATCVAASLPARGGGIRKITWLFEN